MQKFIGNGTVLKCTTSTTVSSSLATTIGGVTGVDGPTGPAASVDTHTLDSTTNDATQEKGFAVPGDLSVTVAYNQADAGWVKIKAMRGKTTKGKFVITHPSTNFADEVHKGFVKDVGRAIARDTITTRTITVGLSSGPGWN
jgi:hypothetical protein